MKFKPGQSGNPSGKKPGTLNKKTQLVKMFELHAPELINKCIELALSGDIAALKLAIERIIPRAKDAPLTINLPEEKITSLSLGNIAEDVVRLMAAGEVTPEQSKSIFETIKLFRDNLSLDEIVTQISSLREEISKMKNRNTGISYAE